MNHRDRVDNFNGGPAALPVEALEKAQAELLNFAETGASIVEISHRSKAYEAVHQQTKALLKELLEVPDDYEILFLQGGASLQFAMVAMNLLDNEHTGAYALTGSWSKKAREEAARVGRVRTVFDGAESEFRTIPGVEQVVPAPGDAYLHLTSNNTIYGTQWHAFPDTGEVPLVADMSSDILSHRIPVRQFSLIYAGAQKNLGPAGVTVVIIKSSLVARAKAIAEEKNIPVILRYDLHAKHDSLYNTPPVFAIYLMGLVLEWLRDHGGVAQAEARGRQKGKLIYDAIDNSDGFYRGYAAPDSRSYTNVTFNLPTRELEQAFLAGAEENGMIGLGGHRSVGGCRASIYNAVSVEACERLAEYMDSFRRVHG
ncbi:phosphoserine transaminase [Alicyclobacillus cycloheptanicus]|uniref:Phosphoserine aminotransferase n=1 Tax=Alicyclobacillus cycloheptanicus TaxID=1457 RepID=A0ABT9XGW5_9BACL|nr:phosphoserine transaminase [Alicyclobacillus cycloheptanicus]MDQ0189547.1 phosphoserine aminotransferase [Alicyclobacillus cycloheptanicus]WDM01602.1 phosphoserine transaminase [Alicyclobacillus cycloheptanicus]